ncbi:MAG: hypothetical protein FWH27_18270, partial [Planctomycetaceae bacterium]|nr:hypothetical protein [Planctomycetaceae bacterium]
MRHVNPLLSLAIVLFLVVSFLAACRNKASSVVVPPDQLSDLLEKARQINDDHGKMLAYWLVARAQIQAGDADGARQTIDQIKEVATKFREDGDKLWAFLCVAYAQVDAGDMVEARKTFDQANYQFKYQEASAQMSQAIAYLTIARAQIKVGDLAGARETAKQIRSEDFYKPLAYREIAA